MKLTHVINDQRNNSVFEFIGDIPFNKFHNLGLLSKSFNVKEMLFHEFENKFHEDWHTPSLGPVYVLFLSGKQEIEVTSGRKKIFGVDDIVLFADMKGKGHKTKVLEGGLSVILKK